MRSGLHGTFATLLLMVPVLSIPALAIFGIPQFAPVVASPLDESPGRDRERRVGQSARPANESFPEDLEDAPSFGSEPIDRTSNVAPVRPGEAAPFSRSGRAVPNKSSSFDAAESRFNNTKPRGADDAAAEEGRRLAFAHVKGYPPGAVRRADNDDGAADEHRPSPFGDDSLKTRPNERPNNDARDNPFDSKQSAPPEFRPPQFQRTSMPGSGTSQPPRAFQRQPGSPPEGDADARPAATVTEDEPLTWPSAVRRLNELEIRNFRLQPGHRENQFVFICSYTPSDSPRVSYRFEAEADEPLKAVEKVLEQIVEWQQRR